MRPINTIFLHCSATREGQDFKERDIRRCHLARGFKTTGYHFIIDLDGKIEKGRDISQTPAAQSGHNKGSIAICYVGGLASDGKTPKDTRTPAQKESLLRLVDSLLREYKLNESAIFCHYEVANKACPCFKKETFLAELKDWNQKHK